MSRNVLAAVLVFVLAACSQSPAPVTFGQGILQPDDDLPPLEEEAVDASTAKRREPGRKAW